MARRKSVSPEVKRLLDRAKDMVAVGLQPETAALAMHTDVEVTRAGQMRKGEKPDGKKVTADAARRLDAFSALKDGMAVGCFDAARRLERDVLTRMGLSGRGPLTERVDGEGGRGREDVAVSAGMLVDRIMARLPARDGWLLMELIAPPICRGTWRDHVAYITGETHSHAQGAVVRAACVNLRDAYDAMERKAA